MSTPIAAWGCVHGRFQPFHNGHLEYALRAKDHCERLVVGITNPDPNWIHMEVENPHRHLPRSNSFTYLERAAMIRDSLLDANIPPRDFLLVPFPIQDPELIPHYAPKHALHFVRVYSNWERHKVERLRSHNLSLEVLDPGKHKEVSGEQVRRLIRTNGRWQRLVPEPTARVICEILAKDPARLQAR